MQLAIHQESEAILDHPLKVHNLLYQTRGDPKFHLNLDDDARHNLLRDICLSTSLPNFTVRDCADLGCGWIVGNPSVSPELLTDGLVVPTRQTMFIRSEQALD